MGAVHMMGEVNLAGIFVSPLLLCLALAFVGRVLLSRLLSAADLYRFVWRPPLFDTAMFLILTGVALFTVHLLS